jgi:16S rRNA (cytosine967-C5)-methyltransferase
MEHFDSSRAGTMGLTPQMADAPGLVVRQLACHALRTSLDRKMTVEEAVRSCRGLHRLEPRDQALVSSLVLTSFRHHGEIESIIRTFVDKPLPRKSGRTQDIVTIGVSQLLFLGMPPHAVIDLAVRCAKEDSHARHFSGLVNAVLRKVASAGPKLLQGLDPTTAQHTRLAVGKMGKHLWDLTDTGHRQRPRAKTSA